METNSPIFTAFDDLNKQIKYKGTRAMVIIAQSAIDKVNNSENASTDDFRTLSVYTDEMDRLLEDFFQLNQLQNTPMFEAHESEITQILTKKTDKQFKEFREAYEEKIMKVDVLLKEINNKI